MKHYCEVIAQNVLPTVRALLAKTLMEKHGLTQKQTAEKLGISQAAISQYSRELRGFKIKNLQKNKNIISEIESLANKLIKNSERPEVIMLNTCKICKEIRKSKLICEIHKELNSNLKNCELCF
jgi:predicted transcriptional regulator